MTMTLDTLSGRRGDIVIELTSPSGTISRLLGHRDEDYSSSGYLCLLCSGEKTHTENGASTSQQEATTQVLMSVGLCSRCLEYPAHRNQLLIFQLFVIQTAVEVVPGKARTPVTLVSIYVMHTHWIVLMSVQWVSL